MSRKIDTAAIDRRIDQLIGLAAFPIVNVPLWGFTLILATNNIGDKWQWVPLILPWVVNGSFLILMFIFRPQMAIGYMVSIGLILVGVVGLGVLFLAACFGAIFIGSIGSTISEQIGPLACLISFPVIFLGGLVLFCLIGFAFLRGWWVLTENKKEDTP